MSRTSGKRSFQSRRAFTLVELLVVIAIIGILVALITPAVQSARENMRRTACVSNMRNVALAMIAFEEARNRYPGYVDVQRVAGAPVKRPAFYMLMSGLERRDIFARFSTQPGDGLTPPPAIPAVATLTCPSNPQSGGAPTDFVLNAGVPDRNLGGNWSEPRGRTANGVFMYLPELTGQVTTAAGVKDGLGSTLALSENLQAGDWHELAEHRVGFVWHDNYEPDDPTLAQLPINGQARLGGTVAADITWARPSSNHGRFVNVAFLDAHARPLSDEIDYVVYAQLMTSNGNHASGLKIGTLVRKSKLDAADY